jgi:hypothetical protein
LFYRPAFDAEPAAQAEAFVSVLGGDQGELPLVVDVERDVRADGTPVPPPFAVLEPGLRACVERIAQLVGRKPLIYTSAGYWDEFLGVLSWAQAYDLWVANWVTIWTPGSRPRLPRNWTIYRFWQYSADGNGQGANLGVQSPDIDLNLFNGDVAALRSYANNPPVVVPPTERTLWVTATLGLNFRSQPVISPATLIASLPFATQLIAIGNETGDAQGNLWQRVRLMDGQMGFVCAFIASFGQRFLSTQPPAVPISDEVIGGGEGSEIGARQRQRRAAHHAPRVKVRLIVTKANGMLRSQPAKGSILVRLKLHDVLTLSDISDVSATQIGKRGHWLAVTDTQGQAGYVATQNVRVMSKPKRR